jgi:hypothetical protein
MILHRFLNHLPERYKREYIGPTGTAASSQYRAWHRWPDCRMFLFVLGSAGGGGGSGRAASNLAAATGGGGGGSGGIITMLLPWYQLPERLMINVGVGGQGGTAPTVAQGNTTDAAAGGSTQLRIWAPTGETLQSITGGGAGGTGTTATATPGTAATVTNSARFDGLMFGNPISVIAAGTGRAGAAGDSVTARIQPGGGAGGGGTTAAGATSNGGAYTSFIPDICPTTPGGVASTSDGGDAIALQLPMLHFAGAGGGGGNYGSGVTGFKGGDAAFVCGGGGGGGCSATTGQSPASAGAGGRGGDGFCLIVGW